MAPVALIALVLLTLMAQESVAPGNPWTFTDDWRGAAGALAGYVGIALLLEVLLRVCGALLDRTGRHAVVRSAHLAMLISRVALVAWHAVAVFALGWSGASARLALGVPVLTEVVALAPAIGVFILSWASFHRIDRRLRDARFLRLIDEGAPMRAPAGVGAYVADRARFALFPYLVPVTMILIWSALVEAALNAFAQPLGIGPAQQEQIAVLLDLMGVVVALLISPAILVRLWRTVPLRDGELAQRLRDLCARQGVRVSEISVWRTHDELLNGALVGLTPGARYILLTDALLERLPADEVEAVMAHEVGHARRHHVPWLIASILGPAALAWATLTTLIEPALNALLQLPAPERAALAEAAGTVGALLVGFLFFGIASRRFERQADAFAVQHAGGMTRGRAAPEPIGTELVEPMILALGRVARFNGIDPGRFTYRHGSIRARQRALRMLVGLNADAIPADRNAAWVKLFAVLTLLVAGGLIMLRAVLFP